MSKPMYDNRMLDLMPVQELKVVLDIPLETVRSKLENKVHDSAIWSGLEHKGTIGEEVTVRCSSWPSIPTLQKLTEEATAEAYREKYGDD